MSPIPVTSKSVLWALRSRPGEWFSFKDVAVKLGHDPDDDKIISNIVFWFVMLCDQSHKLERKFVEGQGRYACQYRVPPPPLPPAQFDPLRDPVPP